MPTYKYNDAESKNQVINALMSAGYLSNASSPSDEELSKAIIAFKKDFNKKAPKFFDYTIAAYSAPVGENDVIDNNFLAIMVNLEASRIFRGNMKVAAVACGTAALAIGTGAYFLGKHFAEKNKTPPMLTFDSDYSSQSQAERSCGCWGSKGY